MADEVLKGLTKRRLLEEMLHSVKVVNDEWRVLVVDDLTVKVFSAACKLSDVTEENVSLVEDLSKRREPMPGMSAIYFISPTERSVRQLIEDFAGPLQMYKRAHVFFSNQLEKRLLNGIKNSAALTERLGTLKEFNMEYVTHDSHCFTTPVADDLSTFYSADAHALVGYEDAMESVVTRLATLFASLREAPSVRFRAGKSSANEAAAMREMLAGRLAGQLAQRIQALQTRLPDFPQSETCDLLILDRSVDPIAPVVHDWSYECLCHDVLRMRGPMYRYRYTANSGKTEEKDVALDEQDVLFRELRSLHVADVLIRVSERMEKFAGANKAASGSKGGKSDLSVGAMKKMVESLPQYREQLAKLSVHTTVAEELNTAIKLRRLNDVGHLEQDLVFGDATSKDVLRLLETLRPSGSGSRLDAIAAEALSADRLRLLMCYFGTHAEKMDGAAGVSKWKAAAGLAPDDMGAILNLELLGCSVLKKPPGAPKAKKSRRKPPPNEEGWDLPKFVPRLAELAAEMARGELSQEAFPYVNPPTDAGAASRAATGAVPGRSARSAGAGTSVRSARAGAATGVASGAPRHLRAGAGVVQRGARRARAERCAGARGAGGRHHRGAARRVSRKTEELARGGRRGGRRWRRGRRGQLKPYFDFKGRPPGRRTGARRAKSPVATHADTC